MVRSYGRRVDLLAVRRSQPMNEATEDDGGHHPPSNEAFLVRSAETVWNVCGVVWHETCVYVSTLRIVQMVRCSQFVVFELWS